VNDTPSRRGEHCPSALRLDQWLAGELPPAEAASLEAHAAECERCQRERAARLATRESFAADAPPFPRLARSARRRGRWIGGGAALAAAAALLLLLNAPWRGDAEGELGTRTKGASASFAWVVRRGGRVFAPAPDEPLRSGDALRFTVSTQQPTFIALLGRDASGHVSVYHPEGERLAALGPGKDQPLPGAIELDAAPGSEQLFGIFCREPLRVATLQQAISSAPDAPRLPAGCSHERQLLHKEPP
jgi:hypothetical protein